MTIDRQPAARDSSDASPRETAAYWFARVQSGDLSAAEHAAFAGWRAENPLHEREYAVLCRIWDAARHIPAGRMQGLTEAAAPHVARRPGWHHAGIVAAGLMLIGVMTGVYQWQQAQPVFAAAIGTAVGERRSVALPDGSSIDVNTQTRARIRYYRDRRVVELASGEAAFTVSPDVRRPFIVDAGKGRVRVTGTRFNVRRDDDAVTVAVLSGSVEVSGVRDSAAGPAMLTAGEYVNLDHQGRVGSSTRGDVAALAAWREGRLVFDDAPLADVVREVARYRKFPLWLADADVGRLRLSSTFSVDDTDALLAALPRILPVRVRTLSDGSAEIYQP